MRAFLFALSLVALVACGDTDSTDQPDNQPNNAVNNDTDGGAIDDPCETNEDCSGDLVCKAVGDLLLCQNDFGFAEACGDDDDCAEGLECLDTLNSGRICNRHCNRLRQDIECPETQHCWGAAPGIGRTEDLSYCTPLDDPAFGLDVACDTNADCREGLFCLIREDGEGTTCNLACEEDLDCLLQRTGDPPVCLEAFGTLVCVN